MSEREVPNRLGREVMDAHLAEAGSPRVTEATPSEKLRVMLVDNHDFFRSGMRALLTEHPGIEVVGEAADGLAAIDLYGRRLPDVVLMDLRMPRLSGSEATERIRARWPDARILILTASDEDAAVVEAIRAGASGYLVKDDSLDELVRGLHAVASGQLLTSPRVAGALIDAADSAAERSQEIEKVKETLNDREVEVLRLVAEGKGNAQIGAELFLSPLTVRNHVAEILAKLNVENRVEAAVYAVRSGIA